MAEPTQIIPLDGLTERQFLVIAFETIKHLGWRIKFVSDAGVIAYTENSSFSWNGEITVKLEEETASVQCISISNVMLDYGHSKNAVSQYVAAFESMRSTFADEEIDQLYKEYEKDFLPPYEDTLKPDTRPQFNMVNGFWSFFLPAKSYFVTPLLLCLNILIFIVMVGNGISVMEPSGESMLVWGANSTITTLNGQWWRLLSNCFLHFGLIHLLLNMYALVNVGFLLEPFLGKAKFLVAYILTGIMASLLSLWWHDYTISAGASGAIFGLFGVFLAILSTNHVERSMRNGLLSNIAVFVIYNLVYGSFKSGIDNAAHIGGLVSGVLIGYAYLPALRKPNDKKLNSITIAGTLLIAGAISVFAYMSMSKNDRVVYYKRIQEFYKLEEKALAPLKDAESESDGQLLAGLNNGIRYWDNGITILNDLDRLKLSEKVHHKNKLLIRYCRLRIQSYQLMNEAIRNNTNANARAQQNINQQIKQLINELSSN
jgi:rhomboid protease GluP